jgi:hypothetical protein
VNQKAEELKARTKQFLLDIIRFVNQLPVTAAAQETGPAAPASWYGRRRKLQGCVPIAIAPRIHGADWRRSPRGRRI